MPRIQWTADLETGIRVIDGQHHRIVDYINELYDMRDRVDRAVVNDVIENLVDYTLSHFAFEETLMEEAGYEYLHVHKTTHRAFCTRLETLHDQFREGDDVASELADMLNNWLISHIQSDDTSYAPLVRDRMPRIEQRDSGGWLRTALARFFN